MKNFTQEVKFKLDFNRNSSKGLYIVLEGIDGSGKTVQTERLLQHLRKKGTFILPVAEPRRTGQIGRVINEFLQKRIELPAASLQFLFVADRIAHQEEVIIPALKKGETVISHRNFWSAVAYGLLDKKSVAQKGSSGEILLVAQSILSMYHQVIVPDITFYLDVSPNTALERLSKSGTKQEYYESLDKLKKVKESYDWIVNRFPSEFSIINGEQGIDRVTEDILVVVDKIKK